MKDYKVAVMNELIALADQYHSVKIKTAADNAGVKRLNRQEVTEIVSAFRKQRPEYKLYQLDDAEHPNFFCSAFVSDNESLPIKQGGDGMRLSEIRKQHGLTQRQLSDKSGVNFRSLQHYEQGTKDINKAEALTVHKLAKALDCIVEDLLEID